MKTLEDQLELPLFERRHRGLRLTEAGHTLFKASADALKLLRGATESLDARSARMLTVTTTVSFASLWLLPRLNEFRRLHPEIDVRLAAENRIYDLEREGIDLAIRYCTPGAAGKGALRLFGERVFPVCTKSALNGVVLKTPRDLSRCVLLHYDDADRIHPWLSWDVWFELAGIPNLKSAGTLRFSQYDQMIQAALGGQGVALGRSHLVDRWVKQRRLILPFGKRFMFSLADSRAYFIVTPQASVSRPAVTQFSRWLQGQAQGADEDTGRHRSRLTRGTG